MFSSQSNSFRCFPLPLLVSALLFVGTLILYSPVLHFQFLTDLDDGVYIVQNQHLQGGLTLANLKWAARATEPFYWHPVTWASHLLDVSLFGFNPGLHHLGNAALHALNVVLLFLLLHGATSRLLPSAIVAALFAVHPLNVETVAWAAERKTLLSTLFLLLAVAAYGWYLRRPNWKRYAIVALCFVFALMSKPLAVTFPVVLLLLDFWPFDRFAELPFARRVARLLIEKIPLVLLSAATAASALVAENHADSAVPFSVLPLYTRLENTPLAYVGYLAKLIWPGHLSVFYPHPAMMLGPSLPVGEVLACSIVLLAITAFCVRFRDTPGVLVGWLFFLLNLAPLIGIIQLGFQGIQAHFVYIPCIGLFISLVFGGAELAQGSPAMQRSAVALAACVVLSLAARTASYLPNWENCVKLFGHALASSPTPNPWLEQLYGEALYSAHRNDEALEHLQRSCQLGPRNEHCHYYSARIFFENRQYAAGLQECQATLMLTRKAGLALDCLTLSTGAQIQLGEYELARATLSQASLIDANNAEVLRLTAILSRQ